MPSNGELRSFYGQLIVAILMHSIASQLPLAPDDELVVGVMADIGAAEIFNAGAVTPVAHAFLIGHAEGDLILRNI